MSAAAEQQELLQEFLTEAGEMLDDVDLQLVKLERCPDDRDLLNRVFRGFHTVKGGAGFLEIAALVEVCHRGEGLLDALRRAEVSMRPETMDLILASTGEVRRMFGELAAGASVQPAPAELLAQLDRARKGQPAASVAVAVPVTAVRGEPDWHALLAALLSPPLAALARAISAVPPARRPARETTLRVETARFDQILNLSGELGVSCNRLNCIAARLAGRSGESHSQTVLQQVVAQLEMLVDDLQESVMKARMQPVGRVFQKYVRLARDLGRQLGKDIDLALVGEDTEIDKTMLEELNEPLVHLVRNSVDHGIESPEARLAAGKPARGTVRILARQEGDHIVIEIEDDGRGMRPEAIRAKAVEKAAISADEAAQLDDRQSLNLIFLPGFSTREVVSDVSGRGVGMDVVKTNIQKLKGRIELTSSPGKGSTVKILLPLTLAILPVLVVRQGEQGYAVPLSLVREVITLSPGLVQHVGGRPAIVLREGVLPLIDLAVLLDVPRTAEPQVGVVMSVADRVLVLAADAVIGQDEVMIKPLEGIKPRGVAGATVSGDGGLVLVLEMAELLEPPGPMPLARAA
ncbi:MAG: chemotaxis protein CheA [Betaproteobacteria bacterium]|nr:chemotaxis protein CheA [Betaproteobacteria bacterium]